MQQKQADLHTPHEQLQLETPAPQSALPWIERVAFVVGGATLLSARKRRIGGQLPQLPLGILGLGGMFLGTVGYRMAVEYLAGHKVEPIIVSRTINRLAADLFALWNELDILPAYMEHVDIVIPVDDRSSIWAISTPIGLQLKWKAETTHVVPDRSISWRASMEPLAQHRGTVEFTPVPGGRGTQVKVTIWYTLTSGVLAALSEPLLRSALEAWISENLLQLKQCIETGQRTTTEGQSAGRSSAGLRNNAPQTVDTADHIDDVTRDSQDSFPASDPPAWMAGNKEKS